MYNKNVITEKLLVTKSNYNLIKTLKHTDNVCLMHLQLTSATDPYSSARENKYHVDL